MTRDELIEQLEGMARRAKTTERAQGYWRARALVRKLDSPPAMAWQDAPSGDGEHYVVGEQCVCWVCDDVIFVPTWSNEEERVRVVEKPLNGRRVCPIPAAPPMPQRVVSL